MTKISSPILPREFFKEFMHKTYDLWADLKACGTVMVFLVFLGLFRTDIQHLFQGLFGH